MLEPGNRRLFLESLRPPEGYTFDLAVGTTYTLDLLALLSIPLAFTFADAQDRNGQLASDPAGPAGERPKTCRANRPILPRRTDIGATVASTGFGVSGAISCDRVAAEGGRNAGGLPSEGNYFVC